MSKTSAANPLPLPWLDALRIILQATPAPTDLPSPIADCLGHVCSSDILSPISVPPFDNSSMDGFAVRASDIASASHETPTVLRLIGEAPAGRPFASTVEAGQAVGIMTGAPLPDGADTVVRVEDTSKPTGDTVAIHHAARQGTAIRRSGADTTAGAIVLQKGSVLSPGDIALVASCGISHAIVYAKPRIALAVGGDEVVPIDHGTSLEPGQIYDSNSPMLLTLLRYWGYSAEFLGRMPDDPAQMRKFFEDGRQYDVLITVGGVSMGEHDYVRQCLADIGAKELFWKINQQPGGPMLFATHGKTIVFGLPGNPVSSYVCADIYVQSALRKIAGYQCPELLRISAELTEPLKKTHRKIAFVRGRLEFKDGNFFASSTGAQDSNRIRSIVGHDGYILFPEDKQELSPGERIEVLITDERAFVRVLSRA